MEIKPNFVTNPGRFIPHCAAGAVTVILLLLAISVFAFIDARNKGAALEEMRDRTVVLSSRREALLKLDIKTPTRGQVLALNESVAALKRNITESKGLMIGLLARLERLLPDKVALEEVSYDGKARRMTLIAESESRDMLTEFLGVLEENEYFSNVVLAQQEQIKANNKFRYEVLAEVGL